MAWDILFKFFITNVFSLSMSVVGFLFLFLFVLDSTHKRDHLVLVLFLWLIHLAYCPWGHYCWLAVKGSLRLLKMNICIPWLMGPFSIFKACKVKSNPFHTSNLSYSFLSSLWPILLLSFSNFKDLCGNVGSTWIIPHLKILNLITSAKSHLPLR